MSIVVCHRRGGGDPVYNKAMKTHMAIKKVLKYFSFFAYYPTFDELYTFLPIKIDKKKLKYTPPQYSIPTSPRLRGASKYKISKKKLENWKFKTYIKLLSLAPQIKLVGLSGSISMMNATENDDIDLFIITAKSRFRLGKFISKRHEIPPSLNPGKGEVHKRQGQIFKGC